MRLRPLYDLPPSQWVLSKQRPGRNEIPRERVRQWALAELLHTYGYPADWLGTRIVLVDAPDKRWSVPDAFFGISVLTHRGDPFLWISVEKPGNAARAEARLRGILDNSACARIGLSTDGTREGTRVLRRKLNSSGCDRVRDIEPYSAPRITASNLPYVACGNRNNAHGRRLEPISSRLEDVFFQAHSHLRDIDGLHADEALDELCKVIYAKLYDEKATRSGQCYALQRGECGSVEECAALIRRTYTDANACDLNMSRRPSVSAQPRSRGVFDAPIRLSSAALVKVVETLQGHSLIQSGIDVKGRAFQRVLAPALRSGMGQYFTPREVIRFIVDVVCPSAKERVLDPFAGSGHFLTQCADAIRMRSRQSSPAVARLHGIEKSDRMVRISSTDMLLHGLGRGDIQCADALLDFANYSHCLQAESFDLVLTNPPFGCLLGADAVRQLGRFELAIGRKTVPLEVLGLERCVQFIKPGGRLGIVLPDGVLGNSGTGYVRDWLSGRMKIRAIVSLPIETFSPFGANIKTSILFARKWRKREKRGHDYNVHLSRIDNVGYDAAGRAKPRAEFQRAARSVRTFLAAEGW